MRRSAFTLIEVLITMSILMVLSALVYASVMSFTEDVPASTMSGTVHQIRQQIYYHASIGDVPMSMEGYPSTVDQTWFNRGMLPADVWTSQPLNVQVVHGPKQSSQPNKKTFNIKPDGTAAGHTAWYNAANGSFVVLVPRRGSEDAMLSTFNTVNGTS